jgi:formylglycine-generating enzyme required for sulfatase activity
MEKGMRRVVTNRSRAIYLNKHQCAQSTLKINKIFEEERKMKRVRLTICLAVVCVMAAVNFASADTIRGISMDFVNIGNAGNAGDTRTEIDRSGNPLANPYGCGAVSYNYRIGKYEVTNAQWNAFTTAVGDPTGNAYWTGAQQPTNMVSWYEAAQFCNYLTSGNKYSGAYQFDISGNFQGIDRASSISTYGTTYVIPTQDEWYKAAYFIPNGNGYSLYANGLNTIPIADYGWNYYGGTYNIPWNVGTGLPEQNGTYDMMGNVHEWNETLLYGSYRGIRGGAYNTILNLDGALGSSDWSLGNPYDEGSGSYAIGFRVASVPEPCSLVLLSIGGLLLRRKRRKP